MAGGAQDPEDAITGINVIPLVDIVLVLLIIFMMTASFIVAPAVDVNLPEVSEGEESPPRNLHVVIDQSGTLTLDGTALEPDALSSRVTTALADDADVSVLLSADRGVPYGRVVEILDLVRSAGVEKFAISVQTKSQR